MNSTTPTIAIENAEGIAAPTTPSPAPHTGMLRPNTDTVRDSYIRKKLPMMFTTLAARFTFIGVLVSPAPRSMPDITSPVKCGMYDAATMRIYCAATGTMRASARSAAGSQPLIAIISTIRNAPMHMPNVIA